MEVLGYSIVLAVALFSSYGSGRVIENFNNLSDVGYAQFVENTSISMDAVYDLSKTMNAGCKCSGGKCEKNDRGQLVCTCPPGYGPHNHRGSPAEQCRECFCGKGFSCKYESVNGLTHSKECICTVGYRKSSYDVYSLRQTCEADCSGTPCRNGGTCKVKGDVITCMCARGFSGEFCEKGPCVTKCGDDPRIKCSGQQTADGVVCGCEDLKYYYHERSRSCKSKCSKMCGDDPGIECSGDPTEYEDIVCGCKNATYAYDKGSRTCKSRCSIECLDNPEIICGGDQTSFDNTLCICKDKVYVYDYGAKKCISRCSKQCGNHSTIECSGEQTTSENTVCGCKDLKNEYYEKDYDFDRVIEPQCRSRCSKKCGTGPRIHCSGEQTTFENTVCGCDDPKYYYEYRYCESRCTKKCGYNPNIQCSGEQTSEGTTICACQDPNHYYDKVNKSCESRCTRMCGDDPRIKCRGQQRAFEEVVCGCEDARYAYDEKSRTCMTTCDSTNPHACKNGATCEEGAGHAKFCRCKNGTSGEDCSTVDMCDSELKFCGEKDDVDCLYDVDNTKATCSCTNYSKAFDKSAKICRVPCDPADPDTCKNGATCGGTDVVKFCQCNSGTSGNDCGIVYECESSSFCGEKNDVDCVYNFTGAKAMCRCRDVWKMFDHSVKLCRTPCDPAAETCKNGAVCEGGANKFCGCKTGTSGDDCGIVDDCKDPFYCGEQKDVNCVYDPDIAKGRCKCKEVGKKFDELDKVCKKLCSSDSECSKDTKCTNSICQCPDGYEGEECDFVRGCRTLGDVCEKANATCVYDAYAPNKATCKCMEDTIEYNPEKEQCVVEKTICDEASVIEICDWERGTCVVDSRTADGFRCVCEAGFIEKYGICMARCSSDEDCAWNSNCADSVCQCFDGYEGKDCNVLSGCKRLRNVCEKANATCVFDASAAEKATCTCNRENSEYDQKNEKCVQPTTASQLLTTPSITQTDTEIPSITPTDTKTPSSTPTDTETPGSTPTDMETPSSTTTDTETLSITTSTSTETQPGTTVSSEPPPRTPTSFETPTRAPSSTETPARTVSVHNTPKTTDSPPPPTTLEKMCDDTRIIRRCKKMGAPFCVEDPSSIDGYRCICENGFLDKNGICMEKTACDDIRIIQKCIQMGATCIIDQNTLDGYRCICKDGFLLKNGICALSDLTNNDGLRKIVIPFLVLGAFLLTFFSVFCWCSGFYISKFNQKLKCIPNSHSGAT